MNVTFWVKFHDLPPERWVCQNFEEFWHNLREFMMRNQVRLEWIIYDG